mmetsp:Transcript_17360/g.29724  ORF Transcript_17360/g.29724 Transcript_17360/m.29724 type:complete len:225 (-) Transcript_17360:277-951(-)
MVLHGLLHDGHVLSGHKVQDCSVADGSMLGLTLRVHLQEHPVDFAALSSHVAVTHVPEAVEHPCLLVICQVLDRQVVAESIGRLLHGRLYGATAPHDVTVHLAPQQLSGCWACAPCHQLLEGGVEQRGVELREQLTVSFELRLVVVHAIFSCQRLDEVLECHVTAHVVTVAQSALDHEQARREGWVEGLEVVGHLSKHRSQGGLPAVSRQSAQVVVEAAQGSNG